MSLHELQLTRNLVLISTSPRRFVDNQPLGRLRLVQFEGLESCKNEHRLCIIPGWFAAKKRHLMKFAQFYLDQDFDVLLVISTVSQVFRPASSTKTMVKDALEFLHNNQHYGPIVVHGFSAGATGWGSLLTYVNKTPEKFKFLHDKIVGQVWDSPFIEVDRLPQTAGAMAFPNSPLLQKVAQLFLLVHMKLQRPESNVFRNAAEGFHNLNTKTSFLLFTSEDDSAALCSAIVKCSEGWKNQGCKVDCKIWQRSPHVCHLREHPEEYTTLLKDFLQRISVLKYPHRIQIAKKKATGGLETTRQ